MTSAEECANCGAKLYGRFLVWRGENICLGCDPNPPCKICQKPSSDCGCPR